MKIVAWNLLNVGQNKLTKPLNPLAAGYGGYIIDFIMNVVMGNPIWGGTNQSSIPADIFIVIELKSGGHLKGNPVSGTGIPCMTTLLNAMNTIVANTPAYVGNYNYARTLGMITGRHESVGIIYNTVRLNYLGHDVVRDNNYHFVLPRTPYMAQFTLGPAGAQFNVVGIHAPPPSGAAAVRFKNPISFANKLPTCPDLMVGAPQNYFIGGDFNCCPTDTWMTNGVALTPFNNPPPAPANKTMTGYSTSLVNGTLTSVRKTLQNAQVGPLRYLSGAYDNVLYFPVGNYLEYSPDLIGNMNAAGMGLLARLNNYRKVSDHLPVCTDGLPAAQLILFEVPANVIMALTPTLALNGVASSNLPITYAVMGPANLAGNVLTFTGVGAVHVQATQAGNGMFAAALAVVRTINVA